MGGGGCARRKQAGQRPSPPWKAPLLGQGTTLSHRWAPSRNTRTRRSSASDRGRAGRKPELREARYPGQAQAPVRACWVALIMPLPNLVCFLQCKSLPYRTFSHTLRSQAKKKKKKKNEAGEVCFWKSRGERKETERRGDGVRGRGRRGRKRRGWRRPREWNREKTTAVGARKDPCPITVFPLRLQPELSPVPWGWGGFLQRSSWAPCHAVHLGSAVHSFPRAMPAFSCTAVFCASPPASFSKTGTMSVVSRDEATCGTSTQFPRQRVALPTRISSSEPSSCIRTPSSTGWRTSGRLAVEHGGHREVAADGHVTCSANPY